MSAIKHIQTLVNWLLGDLANILCVRCGNLSQTEGLAIAACIAMNNGDTITINIPALTEERRRDLVKQAKHEAEEAKIGIRNHRKDANTDIKKEEKNGTAEDICKKAEEDVQKLTDSFIKKIEEVLAVKEAEIMKV